jgi:hypothetical protein
LPLLTLLKANVAKVELISVITAMFRKLQMGSKHLQEVNNIKYLVFVGKIIKDVEENFTKTSQCGDGAQCGKAKTMLEVKKVS